MKFSQIFTAPNQLTLLRMIFVPFIVIQLADGHYGWALLIFIIAGFSDGLDGLLARTLHQQTLLGQYLDPIMVFSRDISILAASAVLFAIAGLRDFRPSIFGKANTLCQITAVFFVMLLEIYPQRWVRITRITFLHATAWFTVISALHYLILVQRRLREHTQALPAARHSSP